MEQIYMKMRKVALDLTNRYNLKAIKSTFSELFPKEKIIKNKIPKKVKFNQNNIESTKIESDANQIKEDNINEKENENEKKDKQSIILNSNNLISDDKSLNNISQGEKTNNSSKSCTMKAKVNKNSPQKYITFSKQKKPNKKEENKNSKKKISKKKKFI
jgi:hypothetical protein